MAQEFAETGRMTWVVERGLLGFSNRLRASFPEGRREYAEEAWRAANATNRVGASSRIGLAHRSVNSERIYSSKWGR
jgi:hypothetical protein